MIRRSRPEKARVEDRSAPRRRGGAGWMGGALCAVLLIASGCGGAPAQPGGGPPRAAQTPAPGGQAGPSPATGPAAGGSLVIPYTAVTAAQSPLWVAVEKDLFAPFGLHVTTTSVANGAVGTQAMLGGSFPMIPNDGVSTTAAAVRSDVVWIFTLVDNLDGAVVTRPEIRSVEGLSGKTLAVTGLGNLSGFEAQLFLQHYGLRGRVKLTQVQTLPAQVAALKSGQVDAAILSDPLLSSARSGGMRELVDLWKTIRDPMLTVGMVSTRSYIQAHRDTVLKVLEGLVAAEAYMAAHPDESMAVIQKYTKIQDQAVLRETYDQFVHQFFARNPQPSAAAARTAINFLCSANGGAVCQLPPERFVDPSLMEQLSRSGELSRIRQRFGS